ncbi:MAG: FAD-dependent oxidoreductase [Christensenellaceae bacterium]|jgi:NAD(P)H-nitrite reductase large subunit|nr:FAD-dependent oxidoreductase [Christensenellaceae bacterium]
MKHVIIGNSAAAIGAVEGIREIEKASEIVLISDEKHFTYSRPLISYYLEGKTDRAHMHYRDYDFYETNKCIPMLGVTATKIDVKKKRVLTVDNSFVAYDKLLVATGSKAFVPRIEGLDSVNEKYTFMNLDDAESLLNALRPTSRVLILGAGLIGMKCAEGLYEHVSSVTIVDLAERILSSILDAESAQIISERITSKLNILLKTSVTRFVGNTAYLTNGASIEFDVLVVAVGVRPNTAIFEDCGGKIAKGIIVNSKQETNIKDIYAAGDVCESYDMTISQNRILALLPNAYMQGHTAGKNMAGCETEMIATLPMNAMGLFGTHIVTAGAYTEQKFIDRKNGYKSLFVDGDKLKGYIIIDGIEKAGIYTALIRESVALSKEDFELIRVSPTLAAFSDAYRKGVLSGSKNK